MLPHKAQSDAYFKSEPVSRVGSSQRLNQLSQHNFSSRPTTPQPYVTSSLNPVRNAPVSSQSLNPDQSLGSANFDSLPIVEQIGKFEENLQELSTKITSFKDDGLDLLVENLIKINDDLKVKTFELEKHQQLGREIKHLQVIGTTFDNKFRFILKELISCRNELKKLPTAPNNKKSHKAHDFATEDVLKYAMKLAKFTKAPPTITQPYQIHPNNYVWPAEDALRRGVLAQSSLQPDDIVNAELKTSVEEETLAPAEAPAENAPVVEKVRKGSFGDYGSFASKDSKQEEQTIDLDLFDPDDEFSD